MVEETENRVTMKDLTANPAPLGLLGFGLTTVLLNIHNAGFYPMNSMILAMGLAYGGVAQILAVGWNTKRATHLEWWHLGHTDCSGGVSYCYLILPKMGLATAPDPLSLAAYLFMWGLFTLVMFFATLKHNRGLQVVFISLAVLFFLLNCRRINWKPDYNYNSRL